MIDAIQVTQAQFRTGQQVEHAQLGRLIALFDREVLAHLAGVLNLAFSAGDRPGQIQGLALDAEGQVVPAWRRRSGQGDAEFGQLGFDAAHGEKLWTEPVSSASASLVSE